MNIGVETRRYGKIKAFHCSLSFNKENVCSIYLIAGLSCSAEAGIAYVTV